MNTNFNILSVPVEVIIPAKWYETPNEDQVKVDQVAQGRFANWKDEQLSNLKMALLIGKVVLVVGVGASILMMSIPGIILCGAGLIVCLIGRDAIRREQIARCEATCLQLENWLIQFKQVGERLKDALEPFKGQLKDDKSFVPDEEVCQAILKILEEVPENDVVAQAEKLKEHHVVLFGDERSIGHGTWSHYWIEHDIQLQFRSQLQDYYHRIEALKKRLQEKEDDSKSEAILNYYLNDLVDHLINPKPAVAENPISVRTKMILLRIRYSAPQGEHHFNSIMEQAEYCRQNVAVFRSSLA